MLLRYFACHTKIYDCIRAAPTANGSEKERERESGSGSAWVDTQFFSQRMLQLLAFPAPYPALCRSIRNAHIRSALYFPQILQ